MEDAELWLRYGIEKGYVQEFCLTHDGVYTPNPFTGTESEQIQENEDICVSGYGFRMKHEMEE